jgi:MFS family permease
VVAAGVATFLVSYVLFAVTGPAIALLAVAFIAAGIGIGCAETAEHAAVAALAPKHLRGSAFGLLATVQAGGNVIASTIAGLLYTVGEKRAVMELEVDEVGPSLRYATAKVNKVSRGQGSGTSNGAPVDDPWGSAPPAGHGVPGDEPPF